MGAEDIETPDGYFGRYFHVVNEDGSAVSEADLPDEANQLRVSKAITCGNALLEIKTGAKTRISSAALRADPFARNDECLMPAKPF
jgi:hypothetical protein